MFGDRQHPAITLGDRHLIRYLNDSLSNHVQICHWILITKRNAGGLNSGGVNRCCVTVEFPLGEICLAMCSESQLV